MLGFLQKKNHKIFKEIGKYNSFKGEKNEWTETVPEKNQMVHLVDKDLKTAVIRVLKELKENVNKSREQWMNKMEIST